MLKARRLREPVEVQEDRSQVNDFGERPEGLDEDWHTVAHEWARIVPLTGRELVLARQVHADTAYRVTLRRPTQLTAIRRVLWGARTLYPVEPPRTMEGRSPEVEVLVREAV